VLPLGNGRSAHRGGEASVAGRYGDHRTIAPRVVDLRHVRGGRPRFGPLDVRTSAAARGGYARHDPNAQVSCSSNGVLVAIPEFSQSDATFQFADAVMLSRGFALPADGPATFGVDMRARSLGGTSLDIRLGAASFNVVGEQGGLVFDILSTSSRVCALHERFPWAVGEDAAAFSNLIESPSLPIEDDPDAFRSREITLDRSRGSVKWSVDGHPVYQQEQIEIPTSVKFSFGIFTLLPLTPTSGQRLQGRGLEAAWRRFRFRGAVPREA
jgi:Family of unknown function (DUF6081)